VKLARDAGRWHVYGDAQVRWARFRYEGSLDLGSVSWTFFNPKLGVRRDLGRTSPSTPRRDDEPRAGTRRPARRQENATVVHDLTAVKPEKVRRRRARDRLEVGPFRRS